MNRMEERENKKNSRKEKKLKMTREYSASREEEKVREVTFFLVV